MLALATGALWLGCTQDFDQFEPGSTATTTTTSGTGGAGQGGDNGGGQGGATTCSSAAECDDDNPCTTDTCPISGTCSHAAVADGPRPNATDTPTDCTNPECQSGQAVDAPDNTEIPDDGNECTADTCAGGAKHNDPVAAGSPCGVSGHCDANGACIGCTVAADCGADTFCKAWSCNNQVCMAANTPIGTPLPFGDQTAGDCQSLICDGSGGISSQNDDTDVPSSDGNACTNETCDNGTPQHPPKGSGTNCGGGNVCDGNGNCVECIDNGDCNGNDVCQNGTCTCVPDTCVSLGLTCGASVPDGCGGTINCNDGVKNGDETDVDCGGGNNGSCPVECANGKNCNSGGFQGDCQSNNCVDGVCCATACTGMCQACNLGANTGTCTNLPPFTDDPPACTGNLSCATGGTCKLDNGQPCASGTDCVSGTCTSNLCAP